MSSTASVPVCSSSLKAVYRSGVEYTQGLSSVDSALLAAELDKHGARGLVMLPHTLPLAVRLAYVQARVRGGCILREILDALDPDDDSLWDDIIFK